MDYDDIIFGLPKKLADLSSLKDHMDSKLWTFWLDDMDSSKRVQGKIGFSRESLELTFNTTRKSLEEPYTLFVRK
jgi:hypothetical protein